MDSPPWVTRVLAVAVVVVVLALGASVASLAARDDQASVTTDDQPGVPVVLAPDAVVDQPVTPTTPPTATTTTAAVPPTQAAPRPDAKPDKAPKLEDGGKGDDERGKGAKHG
jgi:hypothetical protein